MLAKLCSRFFVAASDEVTFRLGGTHSSSCHCGIRLALFCNHTFNKLVWNEHWYFECFWTGAGNKLCYLLEAVHSWCVCLLPACIPAGNYLRLCAMVGSFVQGFELALVAKGTQDPACTKTQWFVLILILLTTLCWSSSLLWQSHVYNGHCKCNGLCSSSLHWCGCWIRYTGVG